jgi:hypothetical protein
MQEPSATVLSLSYSLYTWHATGHQWIGSELGPWSTTTSGARGPRPALPAVNRDRASLADMLCLALRHCGSAEDHAAHAKVLLLQLLKVGTVGSLAETHSQTSAWAAVVVTPHLKKEHAAQARAVPWPVQPCISTGLSRSDKIGPWAVNGRSQG